MKFDVFIKQLLGFLTPVIPFFGGSAQGVVERAVTIPQADIRKMMGSASEEKIQEAIRLGRVMADSVSDFACYVASHGDIPAD